MQMLEKSLMRGQLHLRSFSFNVFMCEILSSAPGVFLVSIGEHINQINVYQLSIVELTI